MMTGREATDALMRRKKADHVTCHDSPWGDTMRAWVEQGYPTHKVKKTVKKEVEENGQKVEKDVEEEVDEPVSVVEHFGFDMTGAGGWFNGMPLKDTSELLEESDEWTVRRNGAGAALKYWKNKSGTPEHIDFLMTDRAVWERDYKPHVLELDPSRVNVEGVAENMKTQREAGRWVHFGHMFIWEMMRQSMGDYTMYTSLVADPEWIHDYNRTYTDFFKMHYKYMFEEAGLPDGVWMYEDLGYNKGLFASPQTLAEMIFPYFAELVEFFHSYDLPVVLHTCGSTTEALPMIVDAGFDALNPMERKAGNDPFMFAEKYGDTLAFVGGLDARVYETGDKAHIRKEVTAYIEGMKARGARLVFASDHSISTNTTYESFKYGMEVYREHMMY